VPVCGVETLDGTLPVLAAQHSNSCCSFTSQLVHVYGASGEAASRFGCGTEENYAVIRKKPDRGLWLAKLY